MSLHSGLTGLVGIAALMLSLPNFAEAQTIPIPELKPKPPESQEPPSTDFAMKVQLEAHENKTLANLGYFQVSNFALAVSNSSDLCYVTPPTCEFDLEGESIIDMFDPSQRMLSGTLKVDTGNLTGTILLNAVWHTVGEREQEGQTVQLIEGTLGAGSDLSIAPEYQSQINGTLASNGENLILEAHGVVGNPEESGSPWYESG
jgi:hypothetical protein